MLLVTFRTDSYMQRTGFHASYDFILPTTTAEPTTTPASSADEDLAHYVGGGGLEGDMDDLEDPLSAKFVEPSMKREGEKVNVTRIKGDIPFGIQGGGFYQPSGQDGNEGSILDNETYVTILWILLVSLLLLTIVLALVLIVVCRHNK
ncbi:uncharacterized protein LOC101855080 [Aplysia californica]|uniref:Uncharacterized protein LOC101855080 n=1 Tax=Aplysia californica TaxID=6500 RepID=A0ABM0JF93_APLCA|nr:uncharacterized protein LOC101855080 [Aplysia californica]